MKWYSLLGLAIFSVIVASAIFSYFRDRRLTRVQASFRAEFPADPEFDHPAGCYLARRLETELRNISDDVEEFDNWRDCGWHVSCALHGARYWIFFAQYAQGSHWELTIEPLGSPRAGRGQMGRPVVPDTQALRTLAMDVNRLLAQEAAVSSLRWALDTDPRQNGAADPADLAWPAERPTTPPAPG